MYGGTSAAAPIVAATYALGGDPSPSSHPASYPYGRTANLNDVVQGNNGECTPAPLCTAQPGWDGPTGLGTPNGLRALTSPTKANHITVAAPAQQFSAVGRPPLLHVRATDSGRLPTRFTATDLPAGLRLDATTGLIYGVPTKPNTHSTTITATDSTGARGNTVISWIVSTHANSIVNGDFESGVGGWAWTTDVIREDGQYSNHGLGYAWLGGEDSASTDSLSQQVKVPLIGHPTLRYAVRINGQQATEVLKITVDGKTVRTLTGAETSPRYVAQSIDLTPYRGRTITLAWTTTTETPTTFLLDDISIS